jgi:hypothetical protein
VYAVISVVKQKVMDQYTVVPSPKDVVLMSLVCSLQHWNELLAMERRFAQSWFCRLFFSGI